MGDWIQLEKLKNVNFDYDNDEIRRIAFRREQDCNYKIIEDF